MARYKSCVETCIAVDGEEPRHHRALALQWLTPVENKPGQNVATAAAPGATHFKISMAPGLSLQQVDLSREQTPDDAASHSKTAARAMQNCRVYIVYM